MRGNLMGKRVNFSARSVITPDPNLRMDQVGIPVSIARNLTVSEIVAPFNKENLEELVRRSIESQEYPGANYIVRKNGDRIDLRFLRRRQQSQQQPLELELGTTVERHIRDGDLVVLNSQPTQNKTAMMGLRVKALPWSTFRINPSLAAPYEVHFSGHQMNLHVPQSQGSRAEVDNILLATRQVISSRNSSPVMGIVQDALLGAFKLTRRDVFLDKEQMMTLVMFLGPNWNGRMPRPAILKPKALWTGTLFPSTSLEIII